MTTEDTSFARQRADVDETALITALEQTLRTTLFSSTLGIAPRRVRQIAQQSGATFCRFLQQPGDTATIYAEGQNLANEGIGHRAVLSMVAVIYRHMWSACDNMVDILALYSGALLEGYMVEREAHLLREQERTRLAWERARANMQSSEPSP
ncbi:MAG: hypothetical protein MI924_15365 [Chloroflexales bacterium]|nr:hypothetical protein [Chloroflexales bacterium]